MTDLFIAPHYDDETLFGAFTLLANPEMQVIVCLEPENPCLALTRMYETNRAMVEFGNDWDMLPGDVGSEKKVNEDELRKALETIRIQYNPETVFAPAYEAGGNTDHNVVSYVCDGVFDNITNYATYTWPGGKTVTDKEVLATTGWIKKKHRALTYYTSQIENLLTRDHFLGDIREYVF